MNDRMVCAREAIASTTSIAGPIAVGWTLVTFGPRIAFGATACVQLLSAWPLFGTPNVMVAGEARGAFRAALRGILVFASDGWIAASWRARWIFVHSDDHDRVYNQAKNSPCALRFHIATEGGWDVGCAGGCLTVALLSAMGAPLSIGILLSLAGIVPLFVLLRQHYAQHKISPEGLEIQFS
jgi:hypothetical protein